MQEVIRSRSELSRRRRKKMLGGYVSEIIEQAVGAHTEFDEILDAIVTWSRSYTGIATLTEISGDNPQTIRRALPQLLQDCLSHDGIMKRDLVLERLCRS